MPLTKAEKRKLKKQKRQEERIAAESAKNRKKLIITSGISAVVVLIVALSVLSYVSNTKKPGFYDNFARCLSEKGMVIYGADWCQYTAAQRQMFGKSFKYINYKDYTQTTGVTTTPTWEFDGKRYPRVQTFETLSNLTGCPLPSEQ